MAPHLYIAHLMTNGFQQNVLKRRYKIANIIITLDKIIQMFFLKVSILGRDLFIWG